MYTSFLLPLIPQEGNTPMIYTAVLNKKGVEDTAVANPDYFVARLRKVLGGGASVGGGGDTDAAL